MGTVSQSLAQAVAVALTGQQLELHISDGCDATKLLVAMEMAGWDAQRILEVAVSRRQKQEPWPYPLELNRLRALKSAAAYLSLLQECVHLVGADATCTKMRAQRRLNSDEERLSSQLPPHFGHLG